MTLVKDVYDITKSAIDTVKDRECLAQLQIILFKVIELQRHYGNLEADNPRLVKENAALKSRLAELEKKIGEKDAQELDLVGRLSEPCEQMLAFIANLPQRETTKDDVIRRFGFEPAKGGYYFDQLVKHGLIHSIGGSVGVGELFVATDDGRGYLNKFDLFD
ncbi:hypothetical protein LCGC14_2186810 [marine sediment metagenome]|uniref:Uncharacterized protein n=2 Tax=marine sediment metagenome TaxID=412755 RepID=A0A0F9DKR0_9ZZZZ